MGLFKKIKNAIAPQTTTYGRPLRNDIEREMYTNDTGYRALTDSLDYQNNLLNRVNIAQQRYKQDGDLDLVIKELEYAFIDAKPPCRSSQNMDLANYYIKAGDNNKAWGYLNYLLSNQMAPKKDIRFVQARILKKEKKWSYAIEMYLLGYLDKSALNNHFQEEMFIKDIQSCVNKLGWDEKTVNGICQMIKGQVKVRNYNESTLSSAYRSFIGE